MSISLPRIFVPAYPDIQKNAATLVGKGVVDALGGFNGFYNYLDNQLQFYNTQVELSYP